MMPSTRSGVLGAARKNKGIPRKKHMADTTLVHMAFEYR
jgi:hypothetical protein